MDGILWGCLKWSLVTRLHRFPPTLTPTHSLRDAESVRSNSRTNLIPTHLVPRLAREPTPSTAGTTESLSNPSLGTEGPGGLIS